MPITALQAFLGMNNRLPPDKLSSKEGAFLSSATNVNVTSVGTIRRRDGTAVAIPGADCHSLWAHGDMAFMVDEGMLYRITGPADAPEKTAVAPVTPTLHMSYAEVNGEVYASNGVQSFRITADDVFALGIQPPVSAPTVVAATGGILPAGIYRVAVSHVAADGEEGPTTFPVTVDVPENGVLTIGSIPQRAGYLTSIYIAAQNDDVFFRAAETTDATLVLPVFPTQGARPIGLLMATMPAGRIVRYLNGRLLVASGDTLFYSLPYAHGLFNPAAGYIQFPETITMVEPCQNGFYLSADQTYWVDGEFPNSDLNPVLPYRAVEGTAAQVPNDNSVWWMSERGVVIGTQDGQVKNVQEDNVAVEVAIAGASMYREQDGMKQMVSSLFGPKSTVLTARSYMEAEVIRKETAL